MQAKTSRERWAETTSSLGASMHAWGIWDMRRLDQGAARPAWSTALDWICRLFLVGQALRLALR